MSYTHQVILLKDFFFFLYILTSFVFLNDVPLESKMTSWEGAGKASNVSLISFAGGGGNNKMIEFQSKCRC